MPAGWQALRVWGGAEVATPWQLHRTFAHTAVDANAKSLVILWRSLDTVQ